jgi:hypothetical protein
MPCQRCVSFYNPSNPAAFFLLELVLVCGLNKGQGNLGLNQMLSSSRIHHHRHLRLFVLPGLLPVLADGFVRFLLLLAVAYH